MSATKPKKRHMTTNPPTSSSSGQVSSSKKDQAYDTFSFILDVIANIAEGSDMLAPLKAACRATKSVLDVVRAIESNKEEWNDLMGRLTGYISTFEEQTASFETYNQTDRAISQTLCRHLNDYLELLRDICSTVINARDKRSHSRLSFLKGFSKIKIDADDIRKFNRNIEDRHRHLMSALSLFIAHIVERNANAAVILQLPMVALVASSIHIPCMQGTRRAVLDKIRRWAEDEMSERPIFWLCDIAGSGKSSVAMSTAASWRDKGKLGAQFFFSMSSTEASNTEKLCSTMAKELAHHMPELAPHIADAVKQNPAIMRSPLEEQFRTFITGPLGHSDKRVIIIIDAMDECKSGPQRRELVETLTKGVQERKNLRIFMTSRPDPVIETVLQGVSIKEKLEDRLHDVNYLDNTNDIAVYVDHSLNRVLPQDKRRRLVEKADGLFIWASTACRMLTSETSLSSHEDIYDRLISMDKPGAIDSVYSLVFERIDPEYYGVMCAMLALLLAAFEPLTIDDLDDILKHSKIPGSAKALVLNLGSVLSVDQGTNLIQFRHPTFVEYLRRCISAPVVGNLCLDIVEAHGQAASWCLKRLKSPTGGLKFNICEIESSFCLNRQIPDLEARVSRLIPRRLRYASSHWLFHLAKTDDKWRWALKSEVEHILRIPYVLYWMEVLSLTGGVPRAIAGLRTATRRMGIEETRSTISEIRRFLMTFSVPIQDSAPHIYISAIPFTPTETMLHIEGLRRYENTVVVTQGLEKTYPRLPSTLQGHQSAVTAVGFSPDGSSIVSGSKDTTIRLWDTETGQPLGEPFRGHQQGVTAVEFSPDGSRIVSASHDATIWLWNPDSGQPLGEPLPGHQGPVYAVGFSPDGSQIVSGSFDGTIRLWDADTGQPLGETYRAHSMPIESVGFLPDGLRIVFSEWGETIRLWNVDTGQPLGEPLQGHEGWVKSVDISPDGSRIVSGSRDKTIRRWNPDTGQPLGEPLRGHDESVNSVAFSPDGARIVSGSDDMTVRLWEADTGQPLGEPLRGHVRPVNAVAFSPDGGRIVSGSDDNTVRLWEADTGQPLGEPLGESAQGLQQYVLAVDFSPDGSQIVSGSSDKTIRLWEADTGQPLGALLQGHEEFVYAVGFSPDGSQIVSGSGDETIRLWDVHTGQQLGEPLRGHEGAVNAVGFSPDGSRIISGSEDKTIRLWNAHTGQPVGEPIRGHRKPVTSIRFSPDGSRIVSGSEDHTLRLWNAHTGQSLGKPLQGHEEWVQAVDFSPDGLRIVSGSDDKTVRLWDVHTGQPLREPLQGHQDSVHAVRFSPDGSRIVSGSLDKTIRLWDGHTGQPLGLPLRGPREFVLTVGFSPDGSRIVCGSSNNLVLLWDIPDKYD
ncbi:COMPASS-like H3K4 histone methylase component WDR5A {ECO:0000303/PubMed:19567704} Short=AtWDR5A {ECO:0000303/PubMed:19567704} [Serendipita indica DSM 11827]|nr:COMPASS-like H3K4 histone methylase component WDR5A {ECO:0000303/PubMed:19567704} Short=AtWDR5A {ECO:0000303/PubMed:19567704} [Serendipita indica DSM 11827]